MSLHKSLKGNKLKKVKNVLKRGERIKKLIKENKWDNQMSIIKLPKTKIVRMKKIKFDKKDEKNETTTIK